MVKIMPTVTDRPVLKTKAKETDKTLIDFSETESRWLGLKFGRCNTVAIEPQSLREAIMDGRYDVVRVKTMASDEFASLNLTRAGFPFYFNGGVRRYKVNCFEAPLPDFTSPDVNFELFIGQRKETLEQIMLDSMGDNPLGYYRTPELSKLITKEMEIKCLYEYYMRFNNHADYPDNYLWFMKLKNEHVGFIALNVCREKDMVDSTLAGFRKNYQSHGLFPNILRHIRSFCREQKLTYFCCGARLENLHSQWAFEKDYMKGVGVEYIFHVVPMLSGK